MTDEFAPDPFMETVAVATGKVYPSAGAMRYANRLAEEYGEDLVMKAIAYVITKKNAEPHEVLGMAEEALEFRREKKKLLDEREHEREKERARADRQAAQRKHFEKMAEEFQPAAPEAVADIMSQVPFIAQQQQEKKQQ